MVTRRRFVALAGATATALAGCTGREEPDPAGGGTATPSPTEARTTKDPDPDPDTPADDLADWEPAWSIAADVGTVTALTRTEWGLFATLNEHDGRSAVAALEPGTESIGWQTGFETEARGQHHLRQSNGRDDAALVAGADALYAVTGEDYTWSALHALDPANGDELWSVRRERDLAVGGVRDGTVLAGGLEFFEPEHSHDTPDDPLTTVIYGIDAAEGTVRWTREFTAVEAATTGPGGAYVATDQGLTALAMDGTERWHVSSGTPRALVPIGSVIVLATEQGEGSRLRAVAADGTEPWTVDLPVDEFLGHEDRLYAVGDETVAVASDGTVEWRVEGSGTWPRLAPDEETLYVRAGRRYDAVDAFSLPDGTRRFRYDTPSDNGWPAAATEEMVLAEAITPDEAHFTSLYAVDDRSGEPSAVYRPDDHVFTAVGTADAVYAGIGERILAFEEPD